MSDLRKAAEMALAKLDHLWEIAVDERMNTDVLPEIKALRQALAEPESYKWEPAIEHIYNPNGTLQSIRVKMTPQSDWVDYEPLKREWIGLTVNEAQKFYEKYTDREELIYAIDKFLEEKNSG